RLTQASCFGCELFRASLIRQNSTMPPVRGGRGNIRMGRSALLVDHKSLTRWHLVVRLDRFRQGYFLEGMRFARYNDSSDRAEASRPRDGAGCMTRQVLPAFQFHGLY